MYKNPPSSLLLLRGTSGNWGNKRRTDSWTIYNIQPKPTQCLLITGCSCLCQVSRDDVYISAAGSGAVDYISSTSAYNRYLSWAAAPGNLLAAAFHLQKKICGHHAVRLGMLMPPAIDGSGHRTYLYPPAFMPGTATNARMAVWLSVPE